jgi:MerR family redox-sensitive transcriptional activator SoxR
MPGDELTVGELARATGVPATTLRYWDDLGLLVAPVRVSGQRRYPASAVDLVGQVLVLQDAGFTLRELPAVITSQNAGTDDWRDAAERKLTELAAVIRRAEAAREALAHGLACSHRPVADCPTYTRIVRARVSGRSLQDAHHDGHTVSAD